MGGKLIKKKVDSFEELSNFDLIVNCTGLGSRNLANDEDCIPIRGQVARVAAPWIYEIVLDDSDDGNYIIPNCETVILGGTHQMNDFNRNVNEKDSKFIFDGCQKIMPSLKRAENAREWVGLRPGRSMVRLEIDLGAKTPIIHNYGHGGCGVTLSWGCGKEVLELSKNFMFKNHKSKI